MFHIDNHGQRWTFRHVSTPGVLPFWEARLDGTGIRMRSAKGASHLKELIDATE